MLHNARAEDLEAEYIRITLKTQIKHRGKTLTRACLWPQSDESFMGKIYVDGHRYHKRYCII